MEELIKQLNDAVERFNKALSIIQSDVLAEIELIIKDIKVSNGVIVQDISNLKKINQIKEAIDRVVISPEYQQRVIEFGKAFNTVSDIQAGYFASILEQYTSPRILEEVKKLAIEDTVAALTEAGIQANITDKLAEMLKVNIESGARYSDMVKEIRTFIQGNQETLGAMERYAGQVTTDAINQYSATYNKIVSDDLGLEWFVWAGSLVSDSRDLCERLVAKKYIHKSEIPAIVKGKIDGKQIPIYKKTGLPYGMIPGTNASNFQVRRGGYRCNHLLMPVPAERVPEEIRMRIKEKALV